MVADSGPAAPAQNVHVHEHARQFLNANSISVLEVLHVFPDCIWFRALGGMLCTAWTQIHDEKLWMSVQQGLPTFPDHDLKWHEAKEAAT